MLHCRIFVNSTRQKVGVVVEEYELKDDHIIINSELFFLFYYFNRETTHVKTKMSNKHY